MQAALPGFGVPDAYVLTRSTRRRRTVELSIGPTGRVHVAAPQRTPRHEIDAFVRSKARWIARTLRDAHERERSMRRSFVTGERLLHIGREVRLVVETDTRNVDTVRLIDDTLEVRVATGLPDAERRVAVLDALEGWYTAQAGALLAERVRALTPAVGVEPARVCVRRQKSRWGSCGADGTLYFNWAIVMAPLSVVDYLVVHELSHLRRRGHGASFWKVVKRALPDFEARRAELRRDGWRYRLA
jgi:predicted metal-dependent hydrolase